MNMNFLKDFEKSVAKIEGVSGSSQPPRFWHSFGNYMLNYTMSGSLHKGIAQGRITGLVGPSGCGKSFVCANLAREAQKDGAFVFVIDSENALDDVFMSNIGVNVTDNYLYKSVTTIGQVSQLVQSFLKGYKADYGSSETAPKVLIIVDSLDMLLTDSELETYNKGDTKGDQGQRSKQQKSMLKTFVQDIKNLNVSMVITAQVYANQDKLNGEGTWMVNQAIRYALSQIVLLTKLKLKDDKDKKNVLGITMRCNGFKTRFSKPYQTVEIEVPYDEGMDPYSGLLEAAESLGIVQKKGSRYCITGETESFFSKDFASRADQVIKLIEDRKDVYLNVISDAVEMKPEGPSAQQRREESVKGENDET